MANAVSSAFKAMLLKGQIVPLSDTFKLILMQEGFVFVESAHTTYALVLASEMPSAYGYTIGGTSLSGAAVTSNLSSGWAKLAWSDVQYTASGGSLVTGGAIVFDDSTSTESGDDYTDVVVAYIDPGGTVTAPSGSPLSIANIYVTLT